MANKKNKSFSINHLSIILVLVLGLILAILGLQNRLSFRGRADSGLCPGSAVCAVHGTPNGTEKFCKNGDVWTHDCVNGCWNTSSEQLETSCGGNSCIQDPSDYNNANCYGGGSSENDCKTANTLHCKNNQAWWCNQNKIWEPGTKSCNTNTCLPFSPTDSACQNRSNYKRVGSSCGSGKTCQKSGQKYGFATCVCGSSTRPSPSPSITTACDSIFDEVSCDSYGCSWYFCANGGNGGCYQAGTTAQTICDASFPCSKKPNNRCREGHLFMGGNHCLINGKYNFWGADNPGEYCPNNSNGDSFCRDTSCGKNLE